ncbi:MAG: replicative helicase loader/inhibitor [Anaerolineae bacterium]|nr:replicative helicase loader/inhibitor [Anaerolineae bacterium]
MAKPETIANILRVIAKAYPGRFEADEDTYHIWYRLLQDIPDDALVAATVHHTTLSKWPPSVAELRAAAFDIIEGNAAPPTAGEAWSKVVRAMRSFGVYRLDEAQAVLDGLTWRCVEALGGWRDLCLSENGATDRAHFIRLYEALQAREKSADRHCRRCAR